MSTKKTNFCGLITFDANHGHSFITQKLDDWGFYKKSLHGRELPSNTYLGIVEKDAKVNNAGNFTPASLKAISDYLSDYYRGELKELFNENDIDGDIYVLFSWYPTTDDSVSS